MCANLKEQMLSINTHTENSSFLYGFGEHVVPGNSVGRTTHLVDTTKHTVNSITNFLDFFPLNKTFDLTIYEFKKYMQLSGKYVCSNLCKNYFGLTNSIFEKPKNVKNTQLYYSNNTMTYSVSCTCGRGTGDCECGYF